MQKQCFRFSGSRSAPAVWYGKGTAICLTGRLGAPNASAAFRRHVLEELQGDLFLVAAEEEALGEFQPKRAEVVTNDEAASYLERFSGWREVLDIPGNFIGGVVFDGTGWFQVLSLRLCRELIEAEERERGHRYLHVVISRMDNMWLESHPPLQRNAGCWIPWYRGDNDWGGLNDHHAWCDRRSAEAYLTGRYDSVVFPEKRKDLLEWFGACGRHNFPQSLNVENHIGYVLATAEVPVYRVHQGPFRSCARQNLDPGKGCRFEEELGMFGKSSGWQFFDSLERYRQAGAVQAPKQLPHAVTPEGLQLEHHAALAQFPVQMRPVSEDYVFDWTGLRFPTGLCRRLAPQWFCRLQEAYLRSGLQLAYPPLPLVDDDYPLTVAICQAILQARPQ
ncbi:unnamed protein product [Effrenium voratum]|nr:unnamed protein product [Effrenium voratum]